jgi:predicted Rossmann fold nucleotide-binding protein DprA/Smf involved in DNA uptake
MSDTLTDKDQVTIRITAKEASAIKYLLMKEQRELERQRVVAEMEQEPYEIRKLAREANLMIIRLKINDQI